MNDERETMSACFLELCHLDFPRHSSVLRHFHSDLNALKKSISPR
jgi:hypothetical protein